MKQANLATGVKLQYVVDGPQDGIPMIFLHGITDSGHSWSSTAPFLSDSYRTYILDQRGHGVSEKPLYGYSMAQFAEDVIAFMDKLGIEQAVIVGDSMGSQQCPAVTTETSYTPQMAAVLRPRAPLSRSGSKRCR